MASGRGYTKSGLTVIAGYVNVIIKAFQRVTFFQIFNQLLFRLCSTMLQREEFRSKKI